MEYLCDYAGPTTRASGEKLISLEVEQMDSRQTSFTLPMLDKVRSGDRDVFV
jgi:hypothetical protein